MITKSDLQAVLDEMRTEDRRTRREPPTVEEMLAYRRGELSGDEEARIRETLIRWPELLRALMTPYPEDDAIEPEVLERQWSAMRHHIGAGSGGRVLTFRNALTAIAAALAITFGTLLWQARQELRSPRALPQQTLMPDGQRGNGDPAITLTGSGDAYLLAPTLIGDQTFERYRFELVDSFTPPRTAWRSGDVQPTEDSTFAVLVPRSFVAPGRYQLILYGVNGERREKLETYTVRVPR
jgi:hypothetical protein